MAYQEGYWLTQEVMKRFWNNYAPDNSTRKDPSVSPLQASIDQLKGLPPALWLQRGLMYCATGVKLMLSNYCRQAFQSLQRHIEVCQAIRWPEFLAGIGSAGFLYADNHPNNSWSYYPAYVVSIVTESLRLSWSAGIPNWRICYLQLKKKIGRPRGRSAEKLTEMAQKQMIRYGNWTPVTPNYIYCYKLPLMHWQRFACR